MRPMFLVAALIAAPGVQAGIYKCVVSGQTVFSQPPCGDQSVEVKPKVIQPSASAMAEQQTANASVQAAANNMERSRRMTQIERSIAGLDDAIAAMTAERDQRIANLRFNRNYANNNLAGAAWQQSLAMEMEAVAALYATSIESAQLEKSRLLEEYARLRDAKP
ncbi:MAG: DUF4124 domain-containing protein [Pseudomonadota bacterium]